MPLILALDFFIIQCTCSCKLYNWFHDTVASKFFFSGPLMLILLLCFPVGVSVMLEFRFFNIDNEF
jgi:hypothetical protein